MSSHVDALLRGRDKLVSLITLPDLEASQIDWSQCRPDETPVLREKKKPKPYQKTAIAAVQRGLSHVERGKLIMACGTGKTYVSLKTGAFKGAFTPSGAEA